MVQFAGVRFYKTEAEVFQDSPFKNINIGMEISGIKIKSGKHILLDFSHNVVYSPKIGFLKLRGYLAITGTEKEIKGIVENWKRKKRLPEELDAPVANLITYTSEINGVFIAKALNMPAPVVPPFVQLKKSK